MTEQKPISTYKHTIDIQIRFSDFDMQGHISNTIYQNYFENGKVDYFDSVFGVVDWSTQSLVEVSTKIEYLKPIYPKTRITVKTRALHIGVKSITFGHCIINSDTGELMSTCTAVLVCFDPVLKQSIPVPDTWRKNIIEYEGDL